MKLIWTYFNEVNEEKYFAPEYWTTNYSIDNFIFTAKIRKNTINKKYVVHIVSNNSLTYYVKDYTQLKNAKRGVERLFNRFSKLDLSWFKVA